MQLFDLPARLPRDVHAAVFGALPASLAGALDTTEVAAVVQALLHAGWRPGQLATRAGALPSGTDPAAGVLTLLRALASHPSPDASWAAERSQREALRSLTAAEQPASPESRERWIAQIRSGLAGPRGPRPQPSTRSRPTCALCGQDSTFFVTHEVRLCPPCVEVLRSGTARLADTG